MKLNEIKIMQNHYSLGRLVFKSYTKLSKTTIYAKQNLLQSCESTKNRKIAFITSIYMQKPRPFVNQLGQAKTVDVSDKHHRNCMSTQLTNIPFLKCCVYVSEFGTWNSNVFHGMIPTPRFRGESNLKSSAKSPHAIPVPSMYGIFTCIWLMFVVNVGKHIPYMDTMKMIPAIRRKHFFSTTTVLQ